METPGEAEAPSYYEAYLKEREQLVKCEFESYRDFDKWLITVASSVLVLSMGFLKDIVPFDKATLLGFVVTAWSALLISLVLCMVSLLTSPTAHGQFRSCLDESGEEPGGFYGDYWTRVRKKQECVWLATLTRWLNIGALAMFVVGMAAMMAFIAVNAFGGGA